MNALVLKDFAALPEIVPSFWEAKKLALSRASEIRAVTNESELTAATTVLRELKALTKGMEEGRKFAKSPVLDLGRKIDAMAADAIQDVDKAENIILGMINHHQRGVLDKQRKEAERIEREKQEAARLEAEAARLREQAEKAKTDKQRKILDAEAGKLEMKAFETSMANELTSTELVVSKPSGLVVRTRVNFRVTNSIVFAQAYPDFWKASDNGETLKVDRMRVLEELNREDRKGIFHRTRFPEEVAVGENQLVKPAGLEVFEETKSHLR